MATSGFTRVLADSGLTQVELGVLYGVSRQTIYNWINVAPPRAGTYLARMETVITAALLTAIERKVLPLAATSREIRAARVARMARTLQALKPAPAK